MPRPDITAQPVAHHTRAQYKPAPPTAPPKVPPMASPAVPKQPVAHHTQSRALTVQQSQAANPKYPSDLLQLWYTPAPQVLEDPPVLDEESGKLLEHKQLQLHPTLKYTWDTSYLNELGKLCQGIGKETMEPKKERVKGTGAFKVTSFNDIPFVKQKDFCHTRVVCEYRPEKDDHNRTRIAITGGHILVTFDVSTPTGSLELVKLMINSLLSRPKALIYAFDVKNFYLDNPMENPEYVRVKLEDIPLKSIEEYHLLEN